MLIKDMENRFEAVDLNVSMSTTFISYFLFLGNMQDERHVAELNTAGPYHSSWEYQVHNNCTVLYQDSVVTQALIRIGL